MSSDTPCHLKAAEARGGILTGCFPGQLQAPKCHVLAMQVRALLDLPGWAQGAQKSYGNSMKLSYWHGYCPGLLSLSLVLATPPALLLIYWRRNAHLGRSHEKGILVAAALQWMGPLGGFSTWVLRGGRKSVRLLTVWRVAAFVRLQLGFILLLALEIKASCSLTLLPSPDVFLPLTFYCKPGRQCEVFKQTEPQGLQ